MKIPETPICVESLDLLKRLEDYAEGRASWKGGGSDLGSNVKNACRALHTRLVEAVNSVFKYILDRTTTRELDTFTMHDQLHGRKVAHLMWHIIDPKRREQLTPPEIGMLVLAAHLHDATMALSREERETRLAPESELWERAEPEVQALLQKLRLEIINPTCGESRRRQIEIQLSQAHEVLLSLDTRERHAKPERYLELLNQISSYHEKDKTRIPDLDECMSFEGDSFKNKLIEICVSHNQGAETLVETDRETYERPRFPRDYPIGSVTADLHLIAAALRLADILDFDRERTPPLLFHYLLPGTLSADQNISALEWGKHLTISSWEIDETAVVFRGRSSNHILHHAVVQFCKAIQEEFTATNATFAALEERKWPLILPLSVNAEIYEEGYRYLPYQFELDDQKVYELLMGGAIYNNPLVAIRELVQNAVDACSYRDALTRVQDESVNPNTQNRITVRYQEGATPEDSRILKVTDTGSGMDAWILERWFLKVGRSFYASAEFARDRAELRKHKCDFAPVSEFGIGLRPKNL